MSAVRPPLLRRQRTARLVILGGVLLLLAAVGFVPLERNPMPLCAFKNLTGLPCPLCGGTRAAHALLNGDFGRAVYLNPLAFPAVLAFMLAAFVAAAELWRGRTLADWPALGRRVAPLAPLFLTLLLLWWLPHIYNALHTPKPELIDPRKPIARLAGQLVPKK